MLNAISWQEYLVFISAILILYYAFLLIFYFRVNFSSLLKLNMKSFFRDKELHSEMSGNAKKIIQEIRPAFTGKQNIHELIYDLQLKLEPYKHWDEPEFRENINQFITAESEAQCSIHLSEEDLRVLWL